MTQLPLRLLPVIARSKFSKLEVAVTMFREAQTFAFNRKKEIERIFAMNASVEPLERQQLQSELADHEKTLRDANEHFRAAADLHTSVKAWIENLEFHPPAYPLQEAPKIKPPLRKHESLRQCLGRLRTEIAELQSVKQSVADAPLPKADWKVRAAAYVQEAAALAKPLPVIRKDGTFTVDWFGGGNFAMPANAAFAIHCAVDPAQATKFLEAAIDAMPQPNVEPLSVFDKGQRLKDLNAQLDRLERQEEAVVLALIDEGTVIARRPKASPLAVLGIQFARPSSLKQIPRRPTANGANGAIHKPENSTEHGRVRLVAKSDSKDPRASRD